MASTTLSAAQVHRIKLLNKMEALKRRLRSIETELVGVDHKRTLALRDLVFCHDEQVELETKRQKEFIDILDSLTDLHRKPRRSLKGSGAANRYSVISGQARSTTQQCATARASSECRRACAHQC
jgi:hypothetical protein